MPKIKFTIITLFTDPIRSYLDSSMMWKAQKEGIVEFELVNLREYGLGAHKSVDDTPYGGGDGMLLRCEPIYEAIEEVWKKAKEAEEQERPEVILPTPDGQIWSQDLARQFANVETPEVSAFAIEQSIMKKSIKTNNIKESGFKHYIILCPHYEGYDARILDIVDYKICLGKYVLTGGELPALIIVDSIVRLLPGVLGGDSSAQMESFSAGNNIEYPQYTRPLDFRGKKVPEVLLSGDHAKVAKWRKEHEKSL